MRNEALITQIENAMRGWQSRKLNWATWMEGNNPAPTPEILTKKAAETITWLERRIRSRQSKGQSSVSREALRDHLASCGEVSCLSGACVRCSGIVQAAFAHAVARFCRAKVNAGETLTAMTCVSVDDQVAGVRGLIHDLRHSNEPASERLRERLTKAFSEGGSDFVVGGIDYSRHVDARGPKLFQPYWQPHAHIILRKRDAWASRPALELAFKRTELVQRPLISLQYDGGPEYPQYSMKRLGSVDGIERRVRRADARFHQDRLINKERENFLLFLHRSGLEHRFFLHGCELIFSGEPELVLATNRVSFRGVDTRALKKGDDISS